MADKVRWGVVGTGTISRCFAFDLAHSETGSVAAIASRGAKTGKALADELPGEVRVGTFDDVCAMADVDAVYIGTPNHTHRAMALAAIAAGKPVLCEKPLCVTAAEANEVIAAARAAGMFCMEAMWTRFLPVVEDMRARILAGDLGEIHELRADLGIPSARAPGQMAEPGPAGHRGAMLDLGVYGLAMAVWLLGRPDRLAAELQYDGGAADVAGTVLLRHGDATARVSCTSRMWTENRLEVIGSRGRVVLDPPFLQSMRAGYFDRPAPGRDGGAAAMAVSRPR